MENQMNQLNQQQNRYLESPFVIRNTNPDSQFVFGTANNFEGGVVFKKNGFLMQFGNIKKTIEKEMSNNDGTEIKKDK